MPFDTGQLEASFALDPETVNTLREYSAGLIVAAVWTDLRSSIRSNILGALPQLRKRLLEIGENLRSLVSDRPWVAHERERVKGAMAASLSLRDSILRADRAAKLLTGGSDLPRFESDCLRFRQHLLRFIDKHEHLWGNLVESL